MERVLKGEYQHHFDAFRLKKDGSEVEVSLSLSPIRDARNEIAGIATIARDLTRQRETEKALISYIAETAMRLKNPVELIADRLSDIRDQVGTGGRFGGGDPSPTADPDQECRTDTGKPGTLTRPLLKDFHAFRMHTGNI